MFERPHHRRIGALLALLDGDLLGDCECLFAGGTAIALQLDEFRRSDDIDFLCASVDGYRALRERVYGSGMAALARGELAVVRDVRADQYGIRAVLGTPECPVKFEVVREGRVMLDPGDGRLAGVPLLCRSDLYTQKLLANADRGLDSSTLHRDLIDLTMMRLRWGPVPVAALAKARGAYGQSIDRAVTAVQAMLRDPAHRKQCMRALEIAPGVVGPLAEALDQPLW
jgi:hypothetical protein